MMGALIRALTNNAVENIEEALGMTDATSSAMKHAIAEWYAAWYGRAPTKTEDPCQRLPYAIVNKLCKATFGEYDSGLQHTDSANMGQRCAVRCRPRVDGAQGTCADGPAEAGTGAGVEI